MKEELTKIAKMSDEEMPAITSPLLAAVVIEVFEEDDTFQSDILEKYTNSDFRDIIMISTDPDDNFMNPDCIPKKEGLYVFDVEYVEGSDFNGESTDHWFKCWLRNCRSYNCA